MINNPLDINKDNLDNPFINGLKYNIRNSEMQKERIYNYIKEGNINVHIGDKITDIIDLAMIRLGIEADELTIEDEHELIDNIWILYSK